MKPIKIADLGDLHGGCFAGQDCPGIFQAGEDEVIIRGYKLSKDEKSRIEIAQDEDVVRIPWGLLENFLKTAEAERSTAEVED